MQIVPGCVGKYVTTPRGGPAVGPTRESAEGDRYPLVDVEVVEGVAFRTDAGLYVETTLCQHGGYAERGTDALTAVVDGDDG